ncbi:hypothetical protein DSO57_1000383 [Entomophthora muscae]|uniref:Uncharacterized protein n=1 Tax=Entomophthora muscae TaxID=34485 RepID=A0ACC2UJU2_9FUNG|nr:hypothetical protein DSO57_1000383 [Entomophthora muscae]
MKSIFTILFAAIAIAAHSESTDAIDPFAKLPSDFMEFLTVNLNPKMDMFNCNLGKCHRKLKPSTNKFLLASNYSDGVEKIHRDGADGDLFNYLISDYFDSPPGGLGYDGINFIIQEKRTEGFKDLVDNWRRGKTIAVTIHFEDYQSLWDQLDAASKEKFLKVWVILTNIEANVEKIKAAADPSITWIVSSEDEAAQLHKITNSQLIVLREEKLIQGSMFTSNSFCFEQEPEMVERVNRSS